MGAIFDVSMAIGPDMMVYKNRQHKKPRFEVTRDYQGGVRETSVHIDLHTGTHIDSPMHMIKGVPGIDTYRLDDMVAACRVVDLTHVEDTITARELREVVAPKGEFILFKTRNSFTETFDSGFIYLDKTGAQHLVQAGVKGVGIDSLGIERDQPDHDTHRILFAHGIIIIEGLRLKDVEPGAYTMIAAPLKLVGVEASPARVLLLR